MLRLRRYALPGALALIVILILAGISVATRSPTPGAAPRLPTGSVSAARSPSPALTPPAAPAAPTAGANTPSPAPHPPPPTEDLDAFYERVFRTLILRDPEQVSALGLAHVYKLDFPDDTLTDVSDAFTRETAARARQFLAQLRAYDPTRQTPQQRISTAALDWYLDDLVRGAAFLDQENPLNPMTGVPPTLQDFLENLHPLADRPDAEGYVRRLEGVDRKFADALAGMRDRQARGIVPPKWMIAAVLGQMREFVATPPDQNSLFTTFVGRVGPLDTLAPDEKDRLYGAVAAAIREHVYPAYQQAIAYLADLQTHGRETDGVWSLPDGDAYYRQALRHQTTTDLTPEEVHNLGLQEVARIEAEIRAALPAAGALATGDLRPLLRQVAGASGIRRLDTPAQKEQLLADYQALIRRTDPRLDALFAIRPSIPLTVAAVPAYRHGNAPGGYYFPPPLDGTRPGIFYVNLDAGSTATNGMPTLVYHEAIPGHHFQLSIQAELQGAPTFRRAVVFNAHAEGWALYAEHLAAEAGFYAADPAGNLGRLQAELFRAARLVVDTGIHALRWTRQQGVDYLLAHSALSDGAAHFEVDRYIAWPGQACGYKIGERQILALRERAQQALGTRFDLKAFHTLVLQNGSLPLPVLAQVVDAYIAAQK